MQIATSFSTPKAAALALLSSDETWSYKEGGFLGNICVAQKPITPKQRHWIAGLLERAELPPLHD